MKKINKQEAIDYIHGILKDKVKKASVQKDSIRSQCPYHGGSNPTAFRVHFRKSEPFFNCWSCGANGSIAELVAYLTGKSLKKASSHLVQHTTIGDFSVKGLLSKLSKAKEIIKDLEIGNVDIPDRSVNEAPMYRYLEKRSKLAHGMLMPEYIINKYGLYYCNSGRYNGRIIMPIRMDGKTVGFNDRTIVDDSPLKSLHQKNSNFDSLVYGLNESLGKKIVVVVEGAFDVYQIMCFFARNNKRYADYGAVALMGSNLSHEKAALIALMFDEAILMLDHDKAGLKGLENAYILNQIIPTRIITKALPFGKDPGKCSEQEFVEYLKYREKKKESFLDRLRDKQSMIERTYANQSKNS